MITELYQMNSEEKWKKIKADAPHGSNAFVESRFGFVDYLRIYHTGRIEVFLKGEWCELSGEGSKEIQPFIQRL